jgi:hypothetical protein
VKFDHTEQEIIRQYLLGQAPLEDSSQVEERLLTDGEFYQELLIVEDELIDRYLSGELSEPERQSYQTHFLLPPERQQKLRFARSLKKYVSSLGTAQPHEDIATDKSAGAAEVAEPPPKKRPVFSFLPFGNPIVSYALAAAILLIVGGASWVVFKNWGTPAPREPGRVLAVMLTPGLTRDEGEGIKRIPIPPGTDTVQLQLQIAGADQYQSYRALLQTTEGVEKLEANDLKATTTGTSVVISLQLAAGVLTRDDYYVKLSGLTPRGEYEDVGRYSFRVVRN